MNSQSAGTQGARFILLVVVAGLFASGCRSYGGQGAEEATYRQMMEANQVFEDELRRAEADLSRLEAAAGESEVLGVLAAQYARIVEGHRVVLAEHAIYIDRLSEDSNYRDLNQTFGAMVSQQRTIRTQYEGVLSNVWQGFAEQDTATVGERPYALIPPYYRRVSSEQRGVSVEDVLTEVRSGRMPGPGFQILAPEPEAASRTGDVSSDSGTGTEGAGPGASGH